MYFAWCTQFKDQECNEKNCCLLQNEGNNNEEIIITKMENKNWSLSCEK